MLSALLCFSAAAPVNAASSDAEKREPVAAYAQEETNTLISNMTDIDADAYYADAVEWALENGVTKGTTATTFSPDDTCTRGQVVTFLWRAEGSPEPSSLENPFEDVAESAYFYKAVLWAVEQGITNGTSETAFSPYQKCSQAHILTFIWRENGEPSASSGGAIASAFRSRWAYRAVSWAESDRLIDNATASSFNPASDCPRADVMLYLYRNIWESVEQESAVFSSYTEVTFSETVYEATDAADFTNAALSLISQYESVVSTNNVQGEYASARIVVSANEKLPDFQEYNVAQVICDASGNYLIQFNDASDAESCAKYLNSLPSVEYAEPDAIITVDPVQHNADASADSYSWGVSATHADQYASYIQAKGQNQTVIVAVVDTGVDSTHPFLRGRIVSGYDFIEKDNSPQDKNGHGTHVSGTVVDCTPGLNVKIMPVRVFEYNSGSAYVIAQGIRYAADHGANVINLSLGGPHSAFYEEAINYAISKNVTVVVSAGNDNSDTASYCPAHIERCITVSAVNQQKNKASFPTGETLWILRLPALTFVVARRMENMRYIKVRPWRLRTFPPPPRFCFMTKANCRCRRPLRRN